ncbi:expressed unknown protein [Seminavis robusta]|uniref:Uncharacterized protein n=1 Tax=Seminavis robusta TaxID=568900 RepID=A0A9N8H9J7_9STRA|nr:expressed unknown protein [Seminavis robusta]|eukprot:Sro257_g100901.1  (508) ;mRNA; f:56398-57921
MDPSALFAALNNPVPTSNWAVSKHQALEMVLMAKADLETVKTFYEFYPEALTKELFHNVLKCGAKPGVVGFLAEKCPELVDVDAFEMAVVQGPGPDRPTEVEIITLAELNPSVLGPAPGPYTLIPGSLLLILNWKYSQELTQALFKVFELKTNDFDLCDNLFELPGDCPWVDENFTAKRTALDMEALMGMAPVLDSQKTHTIISRCMEWELDACLAFIHRALSNQSLQTFCFTFPKVSQEEQQHQGGEATWFTTPLFQELLSQCTVQNVLSHFVPSNPLAVDFVTTGLCKMPYLKGVSLRVDGDVADLAPTVSSFLSRNSSLTVLSLRATTDTTEKGLDAIIRTLEHDHIVQVFMYSQENVQHNKFERYQEMFVEILDKSNISLNRVTFNDGCNADKMQGYLCNKLHPSEHLLPFYTSLNWLGRKQALDPESTQVEFVELLETVQDIQLLRCGNEDHVTAEATAEDKFNLLYGLLRENPAKWSHASNNNNLPSKPGNGGWGRNQIEV